MPGVSGKRGSQGARRSRRRQAIDDDTTPARMLRQLSKTKMCHFWPHCPRRSQCPFAHGMAELRGRPNLTKTSLCTEWLAGRCNLESQDCSFAHGYPDMRATEEFMTKAAGKHGHARGQEMGAVGPFIGADPTAPHGLPEQEAPESSPQPLSSSGGLWAPAQTDLDHSASDVCPPLQQCFFAPEVAEVAELSGKGAGVEWDKAAKLDRRGGGQESDQHRVQDGDDRSSGENFPSVLMISETSRLSTRGALGSSSSVDCFIQASSLQQHVVRGLPSQAGGAAESRIPATGGEQNTGAEVEHVPREPDIRGEEGCTSPSSFENCIGAQRLLSTVDSSSGGTFCFRCGSSRASASSGRVPEAEDPAADVESQRRDQACGAHTPRITVSILGNNIGQVPHDIRSSAGCPSCASIVEFISIINSLSEGNFANVNITMHL